MKRLLNILLILGLLCTPGCRRHKAGDHTDMPADDDLKGTITISGAWALYPMVVKWAEEFQRIHPGVKVDVAAGGAGKGMADCLAKVVDIGMVSRDIYPAEIEKGAWWLSVTKDAVVPVVGRGNPAIKELLAKGVRKEAFIDIWITGRAKVWGDVIPGRSAGSGSADAIHVYTRSDACGAAKTWAECLGGNQEDLLGVGVYGDPGLAEAVKKDALGIGFNNINYIYDAKTKEEVGDLKVLPIDLNGNGVLDEGEDFYSSRDKIVGAIAAGRYPSPPARMLHLVSKGRPRRKVVLEFIRWILTDGQKYIPEAGYINLSEEKIAEELNKLDVDD